MTIVEFAHRTKDTFLHAAAVIAASILIVPPAIIIAGVFLPQLRPQMTADVPAVSAVAPNDALRNSTNGEATPPANDPRTPEEKEADAQWLMVRYNQNSSNNTALVATYRSLTQTQATNIAEMLSRVAATHQSVQEWNKPLSVGQVLPETAPLQNIPGGDGWRYLADRGRFYVVGPNDRQVRARIEQVDPTPQTAGPKTGGDHRTIPWEQQRNQNPTIMPMPYRPEQSPPPMLPYR